MITKESLIENFKSLGIKENDTVFLRGNLGKVGRIRDKNLFLDSLKELIGDGGTMVTLGFSSYFPIFKKNDNIVFDKNCESTTGALSKLFMMRDGCLRSAHPTNSFIAVGAQAEKIVEGHDENSQSYDPMKHLIELNAKMVIFGIIADSPGFTTVHYAQQELGLTKKSFLSGKFGAYYMKDGEKKLFVRQDVGGCSGGFGKFYQYYIDKNVATFGNIGSASAMCVDAPKAYEIDFELIKNNNSFYFCDDPLCLSCRATWKYDMKYLPNFLVLKLFNKFKKVFK